MTERHNGPAEDSIEQFIERFGGITEEEGMPRTAGRMFALLLSAGGPISFSDMAERLRVSRGGVSTNARLLEEMGMVERVTRPGDRQDYFQFPADAWQRQLERQLARERKTRICVEALLDGKPDLPAAAVARLEYLVGLLDGSEKWNRETLNRIAADLA